jgi:hypothetical protein
VTHCRRERGPRKTPGSPWKDGSGAFALTVGGVLGGCSEGPSISANVSGPTNGALVSDVRCVEQNGTVTVTGTVTRNTVGRQANLVTYGGLEVFVHDSAGRQIGATPQRFGSMDIEIHGQVQRFHLTVSLRGTPAVCDLDWSAGYPGGNIN